MKRIIEIFPAYIAAIIALVIYLFTLAPSVIQIDSGELATVQATLGIAHPTGYPLFTMLGYLWQLLPSPFSKIMMANLFSLLWCVLSVFLFVKALEIALGGYNLVPEKKEKNKKQNDQPENDAALIRSVSVVIGGLFLAFSKTFWFQSTSIEVYSLHLFFITSLFYVIVKILFETNDILNRNWFFLSVLLALSFSNHLTTILMIPGVTLVFFISNGFKKSAFVLLAKMIILFIPILLIIYSYLPIRASFDPLLNWGNPDNLERFWRHFSGAQYRTWLFSSFDSAQKQLSYFLNNLPTEFTIIGLALITGGFYLVFRYSKKLFFFLIINTIATIGYSINYDINDIDSYFLLAYINLAASIPFTIHFLLIKPKQKYFRIAAFSILILSTIYLGWDNYKSVNQHNNYVFEDYTKTLLKSVEPNSIILSYQWDFFISASYYFQKVEEFRTDVVIIDKELLRRSWYYDQLKNNYSEIVNSLDEEIGGFLTALKPFEDDRTFNPQTLEHYYQSIMTGLVANNISNSNFYLGIEMVQNELRSGAFKLPEGYSIVPDLLLFRVVKGTEYVECGLPDFNIRFTDAENKYTTFIKTTIYNMLTFRGLYELTYNKKERALLFANKIQEMFPEWELRRELKAIL